MVYGWAGTILRVDLSTGKISKTSSNEYTKLMFGARGTNAKLLFDEAKPGQSALHPETPIIIGAGALAGTGVFGASKLEVTTRYALEVPDTLYGGFTSGGSFAPEMKFAGYDNILIKGRAKNPVYLYIENGDVQLKNAKGVWGKGIYATNTLIREEVADPDVQILAIGPAGEKLVRIATVEHGYRSGSAMGAPFGAKNLKAVVVRGTKPVTVFNPEKILEINAREVPKLKEYKKNTYLQPGRAHGSTAMNYFDRNLGVIGNYEWSEISDWPEIEKLRGDPFVKEYLSNYTGCFGCPIACIGMYQVPEVGLTGVMRCYDYFWPWRTMIPDLKNAFEASIISSDYGLEKQDIAAITSWLMQLYDKGIITAKDTDGIPMERGSADAFIQTIHKVANREGFGDVLADGPLRFAQKIGPEAERWLMHRRGLNARTIDMRVVIGYALGEAITPRGVSHKHSVHSVIHADWPKEEIEKAKARAKKAYGSEKVVIPWEYEGKPILLIEEETGRAFIDSLGVCTYPVSLLPIESTTYDAVGVPPRPHALEVELLSAATGVELNEAMVKTIGDRIINVERAFNVREGITRKEDTIPERWFTDPVPTGPHKGRKIDRDKLEKMKDEYYQLRGWDVATGLPTKETLKKLGLHDVVKNLAKYGKLPKPKVKKP